MRLNSVTEINNGEVSQVGGGVNAGGGVQIINGFNRTKLLEGAIASGCIKALSYWVEICLPEGDSKTFIGGTWNGLKRGLSSILSTAGVAIAGSYAVKAVVNNPIEDHHE